MPENLIPAGIYCVGIPAPLLAQGMTELSSSELRVLLYIYLHTLGYKKNEDSLSYEQFLKGVRTHDGKEVDKGAGVSRRALVTALSGLEQKGYIERKHVASAKFALGSKIRLKFEAKEFQAKKQEINAPKALKQSSKQDLHLLEAQNLHLSCKNQHVINHGDEKEISHTQSKIMPDSKTAVEQAVAYFLETIPNLARTDAQLIAQTALIKNARDINYLKRLVEYILSQPKIHTPAAVLTRLVNTNSERLAAQPTINRARRNKDSAGTSAARQSFPFAMRVVANLSAQAEQVFLPPVYNRQPPQNSKKSKKFPTTDFVQAVFSWNDLENSLLETKRQRPEISSPGVKTGKLDFAEKSQKCLPTKELIAKLEKAKQQLQDDVTGRLKFSVSPQLAQLLANASLQLVRQERQNWIISLRFANDFAAQLISPQDYQIIRLSLRQQLGQEFILQQANLTVDFQPPVYQPSLLASNIC